MKIRRHAGGLKESMASAKEIDNTMAAVQLYAQSQGLKSSYSEAELRSFEVKPYGPGCSITGWGRMFIITYFCDADKCRGVFGFCNQPTTN